MTENTHVVGVLVDPTEKAEWVEELNRQVAASDLPLRIDTEADPAEVDYMVYNIDSGMFDFTPYTKLRAILNTWAGVEGALKTLNWPDHVPFCRMVEPGMTIGMVEYFLAHTMRYHMDTDRSVTQSAEGRWQKYMPPLAADRGVGILGLGALGTAIAERMAANGFQVHGWARSAKDIPGVTTHHGAEGLQECLSQAEILCIILPLTSETEKILNAETLARLPGGACIINAGRGPLIDDDALLEALANRHIRHATLDVFREEPLPADHPYWKHPNVTVTPHIAAFTRTKSATSAILEQIRCDLHGFALQHVVDRARGY
ncbi:MAG: glyoxylate/hydroxypyruvate reductase A [Pseudomonadota bacterium]